VGSRTDPDPSGDQLSLKLLEMVPDPSLVVTPFSKKQPPPNERPTVWTFETAAKKPAVTAGLSNPPFPFQSDHSPALARWPMMVILRFATGASAAVSGTETGLDHQKLVNSKPGELKNRRVL
jgi:hypothetical protein